MHGKYWRIGVATITVMTLLLAQGVVFAAPATDTAIAATQTAGGTTGTATAETDITAPSGDTTAPTTAVTTAPTEAPEREPEVPYRVLIQQNTPWDETAIWYDGDFPLVNTEAQWDQGRAEGKALFFDGAENYMQVDMTGMAAPFTLSVWVKRTEQGFDAADLDQRIFTLTGKNSQNEIYLSPAAQRADAEGTVIGNGLLLSVSSPSDEVTAAQEQYYPATETVANGLPAESWHHIALTMEEQKLLVYVDGVLWKETALPVPLTDFEPASLQLGGSPGRHPAFAGWMEDGRLYEGALTPVQIARLAMDADPFDPAVQATALTYTSVQPADVAVTSRTFRARTEDGKLVLSATQSAFWETPTLAAGQSVEGVLTVENYARYPARMVLEEIKFPKEGTEGFDYLSQLQITVSAGSEVLYSGPYTKLTADSLKIDHEGMSYGAEHSYYIALFCSFGCTATPGGTVEWDFDTELSDGMAPPPAEQQPILLLVMLGVSAAAVIACIFWAAKRRVQ